MDIYKFIYGVLSYFIVCFVFANCDEQTAHPAASATSQDALKYMKDTSHIREHLKEQYGFDDKRAEEYMKEYDAQTQYFVMHDYDGNKKLDGLELLKSMTHFHDEHEHGGEHGEEKKVEEHHEHNKEIPDQSEQLMEFVDMIMKDQDKNDDGYIDYPEYFDYYKQYTAYDSTDTAKTGTQEQQPTQ